MVVILRLSNIHSACRYCLLQGPCHKVNVGLGPVCGPVCGPGACMWAWGLYVVLGHVYGPGTCVVGLGPVCGPCIIQPYGRSAESAPAAAFCCPVYQTLAAFFLNLIQCTLNHHLMDSMWEG